MAVSSNPPFYRYEHEGILKLLKDAVERGVHLTGLSDPQIRHACIQEGLILGMGSVALDGNNSDAAINNYGKSESDVTAE